MLVVDFGIQPSEAWNTTTHEYNILFDKKHGEEIQRRKGGYSSRLSDSDVQDMRKALEAELTKERRAKHGLS